MVKLVVELLIKEEALCCWNYLFITTNCFQSYYLRVGGRSEEKNRNVISL